MSRFTYKGVDLSPFLKILRIERTIGNERNIVTDDAPKIGVNVQDVTFGAKTIKVTVSLASRDISAQQFVDTVEFPSVDETNLNKLREKVTSLLHAEDEYRLELPDEPDRYYMAIPKGDIELKGISDWYDETVIEFFVPDGVSHSVSYKKFDAPTVGSDRLTFTLTNNGTVNAPPIITVKHNAENGYIGLVNTSGALELGNREEADTETVKQSEILFDYVSSDGIVKGLAQGQRNTAILNDLSQNLNGTLSRIDTWGRPHVFLSERGSGSRPNHAGSLTWEIPLDSSSDRGALNEYIWWRQIFWAGSVMQKGFIKLTVSDTEGRFLYGVETIKRSNGIDAEFNLLVSDGRSGYSIQKSWPFKCTHLDSDNPFNADRGWADILRRDDMLQVHWWGSYLQYHFPDIKGRKSAKVHVALGAFGNQPLVHHMYLDSIVYRKDFVSTIKDIPNRYPIGSNVVIDSERDTVSVDGLERINDIVHGSKFLTIPPGKSTLEVFCSSWIRNQPTIKVEFEERYL
ncbi:distal tail protein Dit [Streptococcus suis]|uniref:distal tail protein Dit n=1 Tax=Streptococcus suis TaxID=1307 RepID=UPI00240F92A6|nr:distal tail protein Dit [Streptococcus suis]MDG3136701.1 phage tail family protein [Streptococcus suis]